MKKLYIGNLSFSTTEESLRAFFEDVGPVMSCKVITDRETGRPRGFAFVEVANGDEAIAKKNGQTLDGKELSVNEARPMNSSGGGGGFRSEGGGSGRPAGGGSSGGGRKFGGGGGGAGGGRSATSYGSGGNSKKTYRGW